MDLKICARGLLAEDAVLTSPELAVQVRDLGDPSSTLALPIPANLAHGKPIDVQGVKGVEVTDSAGLATAVLWQKDGVLYGVGGTISEDEVLAVVKDAVA